VLESTRDDGASEDALSRVRFPAGIRIGAVQPEEIALSIMAEIVQLRAQGATAPSQAPPPPEAGQATEAIDPVCGMTVVIAQARHTAVHDGVTVYFCCPSCKKSFLRDPAAYAVTR
jgi:xanthine dehydrogenase accessory factor